LDREIGEGVLGAKEEIYKKASVSSTGLQQKKMRIEVDASDYATDRVLSMECENGR